MRNVSIIDQIEPVIIRKIAAKSGDDDCRPA
jgi:hypothetical protein